MIEIISREAWRATNPTWNHPAKRKRGHVVSMCFGKDYQHTRRESIQFIRWIQHYSTWHLDFDDIRYNFMIGEDGSIYEGRGWMEIPLLPDAFKAIEETSILLGIIGPFKVKKLPQSIQEAISELIRYGRANHYFEQRFQRHFVEKNKEKDRDLPILEEPVF